jgi:hypothetical protein
MPENLPQVGTKVVHKDDHAKSAGPVWEVKQIIPQAEKPIKMQHAAHKMNQGLQPEIRRIDVTEFDSDYKQL